MGLLNRQKEAKDADVPAELKPYYSESSSNGLPTWARWLIRIVTLLIVILLITLFVRWVWHEAHTSSKKPAVPSTSQSAKPAPKSSNSKPAPVPSNNSSNANNPGPAANNQTASPPASTTPLSNTGPGDTIALFLAITIAGTLLYQCRLRVTIKESE